MIDVKAGPFSVMRIVDMFECFVIASIIIFAVIAPVASASG